MHAPINQFTCQAIYLPTVSTLFHSMPCKATSILCCSCHLISFYLVVSRLVLSHTSFHLIYIFPLSALVYCMTLHFIIWRKMFTYVEYIYIICPCRGRSAERALIAQGATFQLNTALESNVTSHDIRQADSTRQWKAHDFGNECG